MFTICICISFSVVLFLFSSPPFFFFAFPIKRLRHRRAKLHAKSFKAKSKRKREKLFFFYTPLHLAAYSHLSHRFTNSSFESFFFLYLSFSYYAIYRCRIVHWNWDALKSVRITFNDFQSIFFSEWLLAQVFSICIFPRLSHFVSLSSAWKIQIFFFILTVVTFFLLFFGLNLRKIQFLRLKSD